MNVFLSWSGERSKKVACFLREWLSCVIQSVEPWVSSKDIDRGSLWFTEISQRLGETSVGIICLTQENKEKPWILFEAGALAKGLNSARVCTLLIDLEPKDIGDPLAQFNHTLPDKSGIFELVSTLNSSAGDKILDDQVLFRVFETYWPQFEKEFKEILESTKSSHAKPRPKDDVLTEILENTRSLSSRIRKLEEQPLRQKQVSRFDPKDPVLSDYRAYLDETAFSEEMARRAALALGVSNTEELRRKYLFNKPTKDEG
ncbi:toll-Interleukin receptor [Cognatiluteimonas profundi]|uniref:toll-Interleukin receptor n=1 Tax=Cognatiluteimonas profundi TaxID=2594501 RepID=UPI00131BFD6C|nr:toll-Interleukin receptor [Lysobacter profundi]